MHPDAPASVGGKGDRRRRIGDLRPRVQDLEHALAGCDRALDHADPHADHAQRPDQHREVQVELEEAAGRELALDHQQPADEQDQGHAELGQEREQRLVEGAQPGHVDLPLEDRLGARGEALRLGVLLRERLHHPHADDVLLGLGGDVGDALLHVAQHGMGAARIAGRDPDDRRQDHERGQRQDRARPDQERRDRHDREHVLAHEDQAVAEEHAHDLDVGVRPRQELTRLVGVVVGVVESLQVCVGLEAQIALDSQ